MKIYHYVPDTGLYCGEGIADESPLEPGIYLIPAYSTSLVPPILGTNQQAVYTNGEWTIITLPVIVENSIVEPTATELLLAAQEKQLGIIKAAAANAYVEGFQSSVSGTQMWYDSDYDTQTVINRQYLIALSNPAVYSSTTFFTGAPVGTTPVRAKLNQIALDSTKTIQYLNATQMVQLGNDFAIAWSAVKAHLWALQTEINTATDITIIGYIIW